jgi:hypothetical protein
VRAVSVGLLIEEQRSEMAAAWKRAAEKELGGEPALGFAVGPLLREMALALRGEDTLARASRVAPAAGAPGADAAPLRSAVLVRSGSQPARVAREFKLLHRALWETVRAVGGVVGADERRAADEWLDDALAASLDRLDRVRTRAELLEVPAERPAQAREGTFYARPPPLPRNRPAAARPPAIPAHPSAPVGVE